MSKENIAMPHILTEFLLDIRGFRKHASQFLFKILTCELFAVRLHLYTCGSNQAILVFRLFLDSEFGEKKNRRDNCSGPLIIYVFDSIFFSY